MSDLDLNLISQAAFSRLQNVSRAAVTGWKNRGLLVLSDSGMVDVKASTGRLDKYRAGGASVPLVLDDVNSLDDVSNNDAVLSLATKHVNASVYLDDISDPEQVAADILASTGVEWSYDEARRIKEGYLALLNRLKYDIESASVVSVSEVSTAVGAEYARVRTRLLALPSEAAPSLFRMKTTEEVRDRLAELIVEILQELSGATDDTSDS